MWVWSGRGGGGGESDAHAQLAQEHRTCVAGVTRHTHAVWRRAVVNRESCSALTWAGACSPEITMWFRGCVC